PSAGRSRPQGAPAAIQLPQDPRPDPVPAQPIPGGAGRVRGGHEGTRQGRRAERLAGDGDGLSPPAEAGGCGTLAGAGREVARRGGDRLAALDGAPGDRVAPRGGARVAPAEIVTSLRRNYSEGRLAHPSGTNPARGLFRVRGGSG